MGWALAHSSDGRCTLFPNLTYAQRRYRLKFTVVLMNGSRRTVEADSYEEKPDDFITFWSDQTGQVLSLRKNDVASIETS